MTALFVSFLRNLFRRGRVERELDDELGAYLELSALDKVERGMDPAAAARAARAELGGLGQVKEEVRSVRAGAWAYDLARDLRQGLRMLRRAPAFTAVAMVTLALGIGANTAIFSVVDGVLLRPPPVEDLDGLVMVWETDRHSGTSREPASVPDFVDFERRGATVSLSAFAAFELNLAGEDGDPRRVAALAVTPRFFSHLGLRPLLGRAFRDDEGRAGGPKVAVIGEAMWEAEFERSPDVLGRAVRLDDVAHVIVGVLPDAADFGVLQVLSAAAYSRSFADRGPAGGIDLWVPLQPDPAAQRSTHHIFMVGRLAPGRTAGAAQDELAAIAADLEKTHRAANDGRGVFVEPLREVVFAPVRPALQILLGTVLLVLLIAAVNVANLLLARGASRAREIAVRTALGATRMRLIRQFLVENLVLTLAAAAAGLGLAFVGLELLVAMAPREVPRLADVGLDARVLLFALGVAVAVGLGFALVPVLQSRHIPVQAVLRSEGLQATAGPTRRRLRAALVVAQLALAVLLVTGASLLVQSFWRLRDVDPGFRADGVLKAEVQLPAGRYPVDLRRWPDFAEMHAFGDALLASVSALPGVESAAIAGQHPLDRGVTSSFSVVGREAEAGSWPEISVRRVTPGYFRTVRLPVVRGRALREGDRTAGEPVLLVNRAAAERFFAGRDPIGGQIRFWGSKRRIVGVVGDEKFHGPAAAAPLAVYLPMAQAPSADGAQVLLVRAQGHPERLEGAVRRVIRDIDPALALFGVEPLERTLSRSVAQRRFVMSLLVLFAGLALGLAAVGVYGVLSYDVAQRSREIGIRLALGARPSSLRRQVVRQGLLLAGAGVLLGTAGAWALARTLQSMLFGVAPTEPLTTASVAAFLLLVALGASYVPARQATRVDPMTALRLD